LNGLACGVNDGGRFDFETIVLRRAAADACYRKRVERRRRRWPISRTERGHSRRIAQQQREPSMSHGV
jgi:hypothetical protein